MDACPKFSGFGIDREYSTRDRANPDDIPILDDFFKKMLDELYDGVYFVDTDRRILYWNAPAERLSGYAASEVVGSLCHYEAKQHGRNRVHVSRLRPPIEPCRDPLQDSTHHRGNGGSGQ